MSRAREVLELFAEVARPAWHEIGAGERAWVPWYRRHLAEGGCRVCRKDAKRGASFCAEHLRTHAAREERRRRALGIRPWAEYVATEARGVAERAELRAARRAWDVPQRNPKGQVKRCSDCGRRGHNRRTCPGDDL